MKSYHPGCVVVIALVLAAVGGRAPASAAEDSLRCTELPFVYNIFWTTPYGPAGADVVTAPSNLLPCTGPAYALCDFSGPVPMPCRVDRERGVAVCQCHAIEPRAEPYSYFVDVHAILNTCVYVETVRDCGHDGSGCAAVDSAPVCRYLRGQPGRFDPSGTQALMPGADLVSVFGPAELSKHGKPGCTECEGLYAGCMTAPCRTTTNRDGETVAICECPLYDGPYQVGRDGAECDLGTGGSSGLVWSAGYDPGGCRPDR